MTLNETGKRIHICSRMLHKDGRTVPRTCDRYIGFFALKAIEEQRRFARNVGRYRVRRAYLFDAMLSVLTLQSSARFEP